MAARPPARTLLLRILSNRPGPSSSSSSSSSRTIPIPILPPQPPPHYLPRTPLHHRRPFLTGLARRADEPQHLTASARIPYHHARVYDRIADIDSYAAFLPYCTSARVTEWTAAPDAEGRRWPVRADLTAGWGGFEETYSSRVFCAPGIGVVEAVSGSGSGSGSGGGARTELSEAELERHGLRDPGPRAGSSSSSSSSSPWSGQGQERGGLGDGKGEGEGESELFKSLVTRWTVTPNEEATRADRFQRDWTDVRLDIKFLFANPLYGAVSSAVADKLAPVMVKAFVEQAERVLKQSPRKS